MNPVLFSSKSDEWQTPKEVYDYLNGVYNFTLDAAASELNHMCSNYYSEQDNALTKSWDGRVFLNPPYSKGKQQAFIAKAIEETQNNPKCECVVTLIPARTDTKAWHELIFKNASEIIFIKGRLKFSNPLSPKKEINSATFPSCVVVFKPTLPSCIEFKSWEVGNRPCLL